MKFWGIYISVQSSFFGDFFWGVLANFFSIFCRRSTVMADMFTQSFVIHFLKLFAHFVIQTLSQLVIQFCRAL